MITGFRWPAIASSEIGGRQYVMATQAIGSVPNKDLDGPVGCVGDDRHFEIIGAWRGYIRIGDILDDKITFRTPTGDKPKDRPCR